MNSMKRILLFFLLKTILVFSIFTLGELSCTYRNTSPAFSTTILLSGTIVTPQKILAHGWILIEGEKISSISESKPLSPGALEINTSGIIFPGLIDLHNHVSYNVIPRWQPVHKFSNRYEWRSDPYALQNVSGAYGTLSQNMFCEMNTYGEIRALIAGTTSILTTANAPCIDGLVRNLDNQSGFYTSSSIDEMHIKSLVFMDTPVPLSCPIFTDGLQKSVLGVQAFLNNDQSSAFLIHLSEGVDTVSLNEFCFLNLHGLLTNKTAIIHGVPFQADQFDEMHRKGASLIWSPRSNIELYGQTADIRTALNSGVRIALAPDWAITGSSSLLDELRYASKWNDNSLGSILTDQELVKMATETPAQIAGIDDKVGAIKEGLFADLLIISGDNANPYHALTQATSKDVQLMLISGVPVYGMPAVMNLYWKDPADLSDILVDGIQRKIKMPNASPYSELESKLQAAVRLAGIGLAPLTEN